MTGNVKDNLLSTDYDPTMGFTIFFDFALDIPKRHKKLQLVYCFAVEKEQKTKVRALPVADCEPDSNGKSNCIIGMSRDIKKVPPIKGSRCVIEIQSADEGTRNESVGWCAIELFSADESNHMAMHLNAGLHRLPLQRGQVDFHLLSKQKLPTTSHISMYARLCTAIDTESSKNMSLDPVLVCHKYSYPSSILDVPKGVVRGRSDREKRPARRSKASARVEQKNALTSKIDNKADSNKHRKSKKDVPSNADPSSSQSEQSVENVKRLVEVKTEGIRDSEIIKDVETVTEPKKIKAVDEWEKGIGIHIRALENSYLGAEVVSFKVLATVYNPEFKPAYVDDKKVSIHTNQKEISYDDDTKPDGVFNFSSTHVIDSLGDIDAFNSYVVFDIFDEEDNRRYWTATNIVYDDQLHNTIDKTLKRLKMYGGDVILPPDKKFQLKEDSAELVVQLYEPSSPPNIRLKDAEIMKEKIESVQKILPVTEVHMENEWFLDVDRGINDNTPLFKTGDAFDIYVDGLRFLPASSTITKVNVTLLTKHFEKIKAYDGKDGENHREALVHVTQEVYSPKVDLRIEYRQKQFDQTAALCIRVDTVEELSEN